MRGLPPLAPSALGYDKPLCASLDGFTLRAATRAGALIDVLECPKCKGRMRLIAMVTKPKAMTRYLASVGEPVDVPTRSPSRGPPCWESVVLRQKALGDAI